MQRAGRDIQNDGLEGGGRSNFKVAEAESCCLKVVASVSLTALSSQGLGLSASLAMNIRREMHLTFIFVERIVFDTMRTGNSTSKIHMKSKLEEYRLGYARLAAFLNIDSSFTVIRRFDYLHLRLLLEKQAYLGELERRLMKCDDEETVQLYASSCKQDGNVERRHLMEEIQVKIHNYDQSVLEYRRMLQLSDAKNQHLNSIKNWIDGNKPIVRSESDWVLHLLSSDDFIALKASDGGEAGLENLLDRALKKWPRFFSKLSSSKEKTDDTRILLFPQQRLRWIIRLCMSILVPMWTILPGVLIFMTSCKASKAVVYSLFMVSTSLAMCFTTKMTNYTMIIAIISYGAVLATFLS